MVLFGGNRAVLNQEILHLTIGARHGFCSNLEFPEPGVSVITLKGVKIVITERACGDRHCGIEGSGVLQPNSEVSSIVVEVGHKRYSLNVKGMYDAWGGGRNESLKTKNRRFGATCYNPCLLHRCFASRNA